MELTKENYLKLRESGKYTRPQMAGVFNVPDWKLKKWIAKNNLGTKRPKVSNTKAFSKESPESSYWAGFLAADGCVDNKGRVRLYLQLKDIDHLVKFANFVGSNHKISQDISRNRCSLEFNCKNMVEDLKRWNIVPNKSITYCPPNDLKHKKEFIRGLVDGDGTISESFSNKNSKTSTLYAGLVCSYLCRDWFVDFCNNLGITLKQHERDNCVVITMNTNKSKVFLDYIYNGAHKDFRLERKYDKYYKTVVLNKRLTR